LEWDCSAAPHVNFDEVEALVENVEIDLDDPLLGY